MSQNFPKGSIIVCGNTLLSEGLEMGKEYVSEGARQNEYFVNQVKINNKWYAAHRFKLVKETNMFKEFKGFKVGDKVVCIEGQKHVLREGNIYTISHVEKDEDDYYVGLKEIGSTEAEWSTSRFKQVLQDVPEATPPDVVALGNELVSVGTAKIYQPNAVDILNEAADCIGNRAAERDKQSERSMKSCVNAFNALSGHSLSETDGWLFMNCLKMARAYGGSFKLDDYVDMAAYAALAAECEINKEKEN